MTTKMKNMLNLQGDIFLGTTFTKLSVVKSHGHVKETIRKYPNITGNLASTSNEYKIQTEKMVLKTRIISMIIVHYMTMKSNTTITKATSDNAVTT